VLQYTVTRYGEPPRHYDLHALPIAGTRAHLLSAAELYRELSALKVPGIVPQLGMQDLLICYAKWRDDPATTPVTSSRALGRTS
jgi:hypothetical protein